MKLEELMVGDIIFQHHPKDNTPHIVKVSIDTLDLMYKMEIDFIREQSPLYRIIEPIPLTPEILEKNGLYEENEFKLDFSRRHRLKISLICTHDNGDKEIQITYYLPKPQYVHELQHALKLLKIEKTIEL